MTEKIDRSSEVLGYKPQYKWSKEFMDKELRAGGLPFILVYRANGVMKSGMAKGPSIAIATTALQDEGILAPESNTLSLYGALAQRKKLEELGERRVRRIIRQFDKKS